MSNLNHLYNAEKILYVIKCIRNLSEYTVVSALAYCVHYATMTKSSNLHSIDSLQFTGLAASLLSDFERGNITLQVTSSLTGSDPTRQVNLLSAFCSRATESKPDKNCRSFVQ